MYPGLFFAFLLLKHVNSTINMPRKSRIMAARQVHMPEEYSAREPDPSELTCFLMICRLKRLVHGVLYFCDCGTYPEKRKVYGHNHKREDPGDPRDHGTKGGANDSRTNREKEGDERDTAGDRVEDHGIGETVCGHGGLAKAGAIDLGHDDSGFVAELFGEAEVLISSIYAVDSVTTIAGAYIYAVIH